MSLSANNKILIYAPPHYIGNMGDRIVTKVLFGRLSEATYLYDNYFNYLFGNKLAKKLYFNPHGKRVATKITSLTKGFSKYVLLGMDTVDGFYNKNEARIKIEIATAFAQSGGTSWIINFSWSNSHIDDSLLSALNHAREAGVKFVTRDSVSCGRLSALGINSKVCPDLGFLITEYDFAPKTENITSGQGRKDYAVLAPSHTFGKIPRQIKAFTELAISMRTQGLTPVMFASVTNIRKSDSLLAHRINHKLTQLDQHKMPLVRDETALMVILQQSKLVITGRMHVAIFALTNLVPSYILEYQGKAAGLLRDFGFESLSSLDPEISDDVLRGLIDNSNGYVEVLKREIPLFKHKASQLLNQICED